VASTNRKFVVAYIVLVGLPLLGLAGVLKSGRNLTTAISVDGTWKLDADLAAVGNRSCSGAISSVLSSPLVISQSGPSLVVSSAKAKTPATGKIDGTNVKVSLLPAADSGCSDGTLTIDAIVNAKSDPKTLAGQLMASDCASCAPIQFHAVRQPKTQGGGAH
jgi:hypothetical protein